MAKATSRPDIHAEITERIIAALEAGTKPWEQPWSTGHAAGSVSRPLRHCGSPYSGINILILWVTAMERAYGSPFWMTFRQAKALGGAVRKGEKATRVVYANKIVRSETDNETGETDERVISFLKCYNVFNSEQIDGLPEHYSAQIEHDTNPDRRLPAVETFLAATAVRIRHGGSMAYYSPDKDFIQMPEFDSFRDSDCYYAVLAHETVHSTGHKDRLARSLDKNRFGSAAYAQEELVAELGSAFLCADLKISLTPREDHASYIASWLKTLKNDKRAIFTAAAHAQRAVDYIHGMVEED